MTDYNAILKRLVASEQKWQLDRYAYSMEKNGGAVLYVSTDGLHRYLDVNGLVKMLEEWEAAHPVKTYAQDFFEKFPNAQKSSVGTPRICPYSCGYCTDSGCIFDSCGSADCVSCWNRPMPDAQQDC